MTGSTWQIIIYWCMQPQLQAQIRDIIHSPLLNQERSKERERLWKAKLACWGQTRPLEACTSWILPNRGDQTPPARCTGPLCVLCAAAPRFWRWVWPRVPSDLTLGNDRRISCLKCWCCSRGPLVVSLWPTECWTEAMPWKLKMHHVIHLVKWWVYRHMGKVNTKNLDGCLKDKPQCSADFPQWSAVLTQQ